MYVLEFTPKSQHNIIVCLLCKSVLTAHWIVYVVNCCTFTVLSVQVCHCYYTLSPYRLHRLVLCMQKQKYSVCSHVRHMIFVRHIRAPLYSDQSVIAQTINIVFDVRPSVNVTLSLFYHALLCRARLCCTRSFNTIYNVMWALHIE